MKKLKIIAFFILASFNIISCQQGNNKNSTNPIEDNNAIEEYLTQENKPLQQIEWNDGNIYSYDYTETIFTIDSLGNEKEITVYKSKKPNKSDVICDKKTCKWCSKELNVKNYNIEEYPNINWLRGKPDLSSIFGIIGSMFDGTHYYDLENNKIRTEWKINCNYSGIEDFCSLKCVNEYQIHY